MNEALSLEIESGHSCTKIPRLFNCTVCHQRAAAGPGERAIANCASFEIMAALASQAKMKIALFLIKLDKKICSKRLN